MFPAFGIIVAHIEFEHFTDSLGMLDRDLLQLDVVADKLPEFLRGDFTKTFEPCYFRSFSELFRRFVAFLLRVAVMRLFLVPDTEKRRFKNIEVPRKNQRLEKGQEPQLGAIMCWRKGKVKNQNDGAGHVAVVEQIQGNGSITVSQSNYSGTVFKRRTFTKNNYSLGSAYTFQGFLYPKKAFVKASLGPVLRDTTVTQAQIDTVSLRFRPEPSTDSFSYGTLFTGYYPVLEQTENEGRTWVKINDRGFDAWAALDPSWGRILLPETDDEVVRLRKLLTEIKKIVEKM